MIISILRSLLIISMILTQHKNNISTAKKDPFECGFSLISPSKLPFSSQYFIVLILFIIFDVEISILIPFSLERKINLNKITIATLLMLLAAGLLYE
jgi:NADH:ubiquinone oxidoreductase subunit 3 (subunit A)